MDRSRSLPLFAFQTSERRISITTGIRHGIIVYTDIFTLFRRGVLWYGDVRPSVHPSVRVSVRQSQFSALFSYMLWHIKLKFCMSLSSYKHSVKFEYRQFPSIFVGVMPLLELRILEIPVHSFLQFSPTCIDILSWNLHEKTTREIKINLIVKLTFCCAIFKQKFVNLHVLRYFWSNYCAK